MSKKKGMTLEINFNIFIVPALMIAKLLGYVPASWFAIFLVCTVLIIIRPAIQLTRNVEK